MNEGRIDSSDSTDSPENEAEKPPPDVWVRRGEYVVRKHLTPRNSLFSPTQWLYESGNKSIPIVDADGHFDFLDLECIDVMRETKPDSSYMGSHVDTWIAHAKHDMNMPTKWHVQGMPVYWTGETWFQIARPEKFKCPKTGKECTWVLGRKTEIRKNTQRPRDVHPEIWGHMMSEKARAEHLHKWLTETKPAIERAEAARDHNGLKIIRKYDDLLEL